MLVLLLAAWDMEQVAEAAREIQREGGRDAGEAEPRTQLVRALETAIAVCYWRPFTKSKGMGRLDEKADGPPEGGELEELHWALKTMRNQVYAHTDEEGGRFALVEDDEEGEPGVALFSELWFPLPPEWLTNVITLAEGQRDRFRQEAFTIDQALRSA
jgi:hypothetical protein